jgi:UDP-perosamine 4-acetyltransferase
LKIVGIGAGGHARVMIDALRARGVEVGALTDPDEDLLNTRLEGVPVVGGDSEWATLKRDGFTHAFLGMGSVGDASQRRELFGRILAAGFEIISVIHPSAIISSSASFGRGAIVLAGAVINAGAVIGDNVIINTAAVVEHDCTVGDHAHVATGARLGGAVHVGARAHIGIGASVRQSISIGEAAVVAAGAVVVADVPACAIVAGIPAKPLATKSSGRSRT